MPEFKYLTVVVLSCRAGCRWEKHLPAHRLPVAHEMQSFLCRSASQGALPHWQGLKACAIVPTHAAAHATCSCRICSGAGPQHQAALRTLYWPAGEVTVACAHSACGARRMCWFQPDTSRIITAFQPTLSAAPFHYQLYLVSWALFLKSTVSRQQMHASLTRRLPSRVLNLPQRLPDTKSPVMH